MVRYCCVKGCGNNSNNKNKEPNSVLSFHAFPSNQDLKSKWLKAIGRPNWEPPSHARVCSVHFNYEQINYDGCRIRIKDDNIPVNLLPANSNFEASDVEACRICLAMDVKMYSLQPHLATCINSIAGSGKHKLDLEGLPEYICYQCGPWLIKFIELKEKLMMSQKTLLDIFKNNGKITKNLIKEYNTNSQRNFISPDTDTIIDNHHDINTIEFNTSEFNDSDEDDKNNIQNINVKESDDAETSDNENDEEINDADETNVDRVDVYETETKNRAEDIIIIVVNNKDSNSNGDGEQKTLCVNPMKRKLTTKTKTRIDDTVLLKYFNVVKLSLSEQLKEWQKQTTLRSLRNDTLHQCKICKKSFVNVNSYRVHLTYHDPSVGPELCQVCKIRFKTTEIATLHAKRAHSRMFYCKQCPEVFHNVKAALRHSRWHEGYVYKCSRCTFSSSREVALRVHTRRVHSQQPLIDTIHTEVSELSKCQKFLCEQCGVKFDSDAARLEHILTSSNHTYNNDLRDPSSNQRTSCKKCGKECSSLKELMVHTRAEHSGSKRNRYPWRGHTPYPVQCEICNETMVSRSKHWLHVRRQHPDHVDTYQPVITAVCDTCGKGFQNSTKLRLHQLRHRSPSVRCHSCPRVYYDKYSLDIHVRTTHSGDKPHQCPTCGRAFKLLGNLQRHFRVHTDIAPYECKICNKNFKYSTSLNLHVRTVHNKLPYPPRKKRSRATNNISDE